MEISAPEISVLGYQVDNIIIGREVVQHAKQYQQ